MQFNNVNSPQSSTVAESQIDEGLRAYLLNVYNYMASALIVTGLVAYFSSQSEAFISLMISAEGGLTGLAYLVMFAPLAMVIFLSARVHKMSAASAQIAFWVYSALMGLSLYYIFLIYSGTSIARVFFITAITFGSMSLYGYTTKRDLSSMGSFLFMGLIGVIIASIVNIFMQSSALQFAISVIGVLVFVGLTAYDTQKLKQTYYLVAGNAEAMAKASIMGALTLYLDFINLFIMLLQLLGNRD